MKIPPQLFRAHPCTHAAHSRHTVFLPQPSNTTVLKLADKDDNPPSDDGPLSRIQQKVRSGSARIPLCMNSLRHPQWIARDTTWNASRGCVWTAHEKAGGKPALSTTRSAPRMTIPARVALHKRFPHKPSAPFNPILSFSLCFPSRFCLKGELHCKNKLGSN